jgi:hypothetical protein
VESRSDAARAIATCVQASVVVGRHGDPRVLAPLSDEALAVRR